MTWNSASFASILAILVAVLFAVAGVINLARGGQAKRDFAHWGYPAWFQLLCGALELFTAALLPGHATRVPGLVLAGAIMIGAIFTLLRNREPFGHLAPALIFAALVAAAAVVNFL